MDFAELAVVFIVALVVLGPKQLVRGAYLLGQVLQIIKRFFVQLKLSVEDEITLEDLKKSLQKPLALDDNAPLKSDLTKSTHEK